MGSNAGEARFTHNRKSHAYPREAIGEFCEKYFHSVPLWKRDNFNSIVLSEHLFAAISTMKPWR